MSCVSCLMQLTVSQLQSCLSLVKMRRSAGKFLRLPPHDCGLGLGPELGWIGQLITCSLSSPLLACCGFSEPGGGNGAGMFDTICPLLGISCGNSAGYQVSVFALKRKLRLTHCDLDLDPPFPFYQSDRRDSGPGKQQDLSLIASRRYLRRTTHIVVDRIGSFSVDFSLTVRGRVGALGMLSCRHVDSLILERQCCCRVLWPDG